MGGLRTSEGLALAYFGYLFVLAWVRPLGARKRLVISAAALIAGAAILALAGSADGWTGLVRDWAPGAYVPVGYWMSGAFFQRPMPKLESLLIASDIWLFDRAGFRWFAERGPRWLLELLEAAYATITPLIPAGFLTVLLLSPTPDADRYWTPVLAAELACYAMLPWLQTRTPRSLRDHAAIEARRLRVRTLNFGILDRVSIQVNTLPSAHAAGAFAAAFAVMAQAPAAGAAFLVIAIGIALSAVVGRYHFGVDVALGALVAVAAWAILRQ